MPVPTLASRRLDVALQHIHKGFVTFPVLRASHLQAGQAGQAVVLSDHALLRVDYEGVQVRLHVRMWVGLGLGVLCGGMYLTHGVPTTDLHFLHPPTPHNAHNPPPLPQKNQFIHDRVQGFRDLREGGTDVSLPFSVGTHACRSWRVV